MGEWYDHFFLSIFFGIIIQFITIKILRDNFEFNFNSVSEPINLFYNNILEKKLPNIDYSNIGNVIFYLFISMFFGGTFGFLARNVIRISKLDIYTSTFKYANIWHYYFRGDIVRTKDFKSALSKKGKWVSTRADILLDFEKDDRNVLYSGVVSQYDLSHKSDKLERVYLTGAKRYSTKESGFKNIPGDILILDGNRILNINLSYDYLTNDKGRKYKFFVSVFTIFLLLLAFSPVILIPYYLYGKIGIFRVILGILESVTIVLFTISAIDIFLTKKDDFNKKYKNNKWPSFIAALVLILVLLFFLKITIFPHLTWFQFYN